MKRFTDAGRAAIDAGNLYAGLSLALIAPDICASLENPGKGKTKKRYIRWCKTWVEPKFTIGPGPIRVFISAEDCYKLRNSLIHSGQSYIYPSNAGELNSFVFCDESVGAHMNRVQLSSGGKHSTGYLQLKASDFSRTMFDAADEWDVAKASDPGIQQEKAKLLVIRSKGGTLGGGAVAFS